MLASWQFINSSTERRSRLSNIVITDLVIFGAIRSLFSNKIKDTIIMFTSKEIAYGLAGLVILGLVSWGGIYVGGFFNAEIEGQRTKVFHESQSYTDGMRNEANDLFLAYQTATAAGKVGIAAVTRDKFASVNTSGYPEHIQNFFRVTGAR